MKRVFFVLFAAIAVMSCSNKETTGYVGPSDIIIENGVLTPEALLSLGRLSDPQLSPDGKTILFGVSYTSISDNKSCRNLYVCDKDGSNRKQITRYAKSVSVARWNQDGTKIYFLQSGQIWEAPYKDGKLGKKTQLSNVPSGISDYKISPDGKKILYVSTTPGPVTGPKDADPALDKAKAYVAEGLMYRHWDHWVTETPRTYVSDFGTGTITPDTSVDILAGEDPKFELPTEPFGGAEQLDWAPDSRRIAYSCRKLAGKEYAFSTNTEIYIYDVNTAETVRVSFNGGYDTDPVWSPDGSRLAWISMERNGYEADRQRVMVAQVDNMKVGEPKEITENFIYDAAGLFWLNGESLVFPAMTDALGALYRCDVNSAVIQRLTKDDWMCSFDSPFAVEEADGVLKLYTTYNSMIFPTEMVCVTTGDEPQYSQIGDENGHILSQVAQLAGFPSGESIWIPTPNGEKLHCWVLYPPQFDPEKSYSGIEMFNGGPQSCIEQGWSYRWNFFLMAQQGYVVVLPNRHGDSGFGQAWKEQISGDYQGLNMQDYRLAGEWFKSQKWAGKLAGVGASYGGFSVYNMMGLNDDDLFDCFISHAGIFDERSMWYITEESWFCNWDAGGLTEYRYEPGKVGPSGDGVTFGGLQQAGAPYADVAKSKYFYANDPQSRVTKWHTPLLCIHGMLDFRIPYVQGMAAFNAAQMMGCPSKLIIFPEECHWILQPQDALFWHREFFGWLDKWNR